MAVEGSVHQAYIEVLIGDLRTFLAIAHKADDIIIWKGLDEMVESIPANVSGITGADETSRRISVFFVWRT